MTQFHVGQKVVCIHDGPWKNSAGTTPDGVSFPELKMVYHVRAIRQGGKGLWLQELRNLVLFYEEPSFMVEFFRPVVETDISIFRAMLVTPPQEKVRA